MFRKAVGFAAAFAIFASTSMAQAIERQHHLGLAPELAFLKVRDKSTLSTGGGGVLHYAYGLNDQFNLLVEAGHAVVATDQGQDGEARRNRPAAVSHAGVGVGYVIDILRWVPYLSLAGSAYRVTGGTLDETLIIPGLAAGVGLDYQFTRYLAAGVAAREHFMLSKLKEYPSFTTVLLRFEVMWGY